MDIYTIDEYTVEAKSFDDAARIVMEMRHKEREKRKRDMISQIALEIAQYYNEWNGYMTETCIDQFINNIIPLIKRDAQNELYDMDEE